MPQLSYSHIARVMCSRTGHPGQSLRIQFSPDSWSDSALLFYADVSFHPSHEYSTLSLRTMTQLVCRHVQNCYPAFDFETMLRLKEISMTWLSCSFPPDMGCTEIVTRVVDFSKSSLISRYRVSTKASRWHGHNGCCSSIMTIHRCQV